MNIFESGMTHPVEDLREFEDQLLAALPAWAPRADPVVLVVPSKSLQRHWLRRIAKVKGAALGVEVCTYATLVREILHGQGVDWTNRAGWIEFHTRRLAMDEPVLHRALGDLEHGLDLVVRMVGELLDAGFQSIHSEGILEAIREWPQSSALGVGSGVAPRVAGPTEEEGLLLRAHPQAVSVVATGRAGLF